MTCHCIAKVNKALAEQGISLVLPIMLARGMRPRMLIRADKNNGKPIMFLATFCPVCGKKYDPLPARPADPLRKTREKTVKKLRKERRRLRPRICTGCKGKFQAVAGMNARCDRCGYWCHWNPEKQKWVKSHKATPPPILPKVHGGWS